MIRVVVGGLLLAFSGAAAQEMRAVPLEDTAETSANASLGDLDGDGDLDIVLAKGRHWPLKDWVLLNDGAGGFGERRELPGSADNTYTAALADLDGDGDLDLVVGNDRPDHKRIYRGDGAGSFVLAGTFGDAAWPTRNVTVADLTGDGRPEIIVANRGGAENRSANYVCVNDGAGAFPRVPGPVPELGHDDRGGGSHGRRIHRPVRAAPGRRPERSLRERRPRRVCGGPCRRPARIGDPGGDVRRPER